LMMNTDMSAEEIADLIVWLARFGLQYKWNQPGLWVSPINADFAVCPVRGKDNVSILGLFPGCCISPAYRQGEEAYVLIKSSEMHKVLACYMQDDDHNLTMALMNAHANVEVFQAVDQEMEELLEELEKKEKKPTKKRQLSTTTTDAPLPQKGEKRNRISTTKRFEAYLADHFHNVPVKKRKEWVKALKRKAGGFTCVTPDGRSFLRLRKDQLNQLGLPELNICPHPFDSTTMDVLNETAYYIAVVQDPKGEISKFWSNTGNHENLNQLRMLLSPPVDLDACLMNFGTDGCMTCGDVFDCKCLPKEIVQ